MTTLQSNNTSQNTGAVKLSYSSMKTLQSCEQKYAHYKINNTPHDPDYVESDALGLGKAFHAVLERTLHQDFNDALIIEAMVENKVDPSEKDLLTVMLRKYVQFRKASGIKVIKCELPIATSDYTGFIDYIAVQGNKWYIGDLKTASRHDENILSQLPLDPQLNLYAHFAEDLYIAVPSIVGKQFAGCLYSQIIKSKAQTSAGLDKGVKVVETIVPIESMNPDLVWSLFNEVHDRARELHKGEAPRKNLSSCFNFFSPCAYFSQCHGKTFTDNKTKVKVTTLETFNELENLL
jgi:hypothetical protein